LSAAMKIVRALIAMLFFLLILPFASLNVGRIVDPYIFPQSIQQPFLIVGVPVLIAGFLFSMASIWQLYSLGKGMPWGDIVEDCQSSHLVTSGLYRYTRNPMLFGTWLLLCGFGICFGSPTMALLISTTLVVLVSIWIERLEEPELVKRFGQEYLDYNERTSFIIPRTPRRE
jgi:protein-S-isoprenylcysteine O-methyltransferase Ste14